jgi:phage repressor protein C with HTH and peptisase S24 domain
MARAGQRQARPIASAQSLDHHPRPERRRDPSAIHIIGRVVWVGRKLT